MKIYITALLLIFSFTVLAQEYAQRIPEAPCSGGFVQAIGPANLVLNESELSFEVEIILTHSQETQKVYYFLSSSAVQNKIFEGTISKVTPGKYAFKIPRSELQLESGPRIPLTLNTAADGCRQRSLRINIGWIQP